MEGLFTINANGFAEIKRSGAASTTAASSTPSAEGYNRVSEYTGTLNRDDFVPHKPVASMSYGQRVRVAKLFEEYESFIGKQIRVGGWAKSTRAQKEFCFVELNDGSCFKSLQVVVDKSISNFEDISKSLVGASFMFQGTLIKSPAKGQLFELQINDNSIHNGKVLGHTDGTYPIQGRPKMETLREQAHLRGRTNTFGAVLRVRNSLAAATHQFFQSRGFLYVHTPIITASDCEGAGEMFQVTTVLPEPHDNITKAKLVEKKKTPKTEEEIKAIEEAKKKAAEELAAKAAAEGKKPKKDKKKKKDQGPSEEDLFNFTDIPLEERVVDYKKDMFGKPAFLSVSGQLNVETVTVGLGDTYTFGPTFRAEQSHTSRHLCEFWMIEPELAFATIHDDMDCAEDYLKFCLKWVLENNKDDIEFFDQRIEKGLIARLKQVIDTPFKRLPYTEGIEILEKHLKEKKVKFENKVFWGCDLASEHEKYLAEKVFGGPIIVYNYPKDIKAFYMKMNEDNKTVQAMDVLVPRIGEVIGGSAREDNLELLDKRIVEMNLDMEAYWWYRDLRKYGSVPHAGFGLGFERLVMMATGMENIKDVIPFPRAPGQAEF